MVELDELEELQSAPLIEDDEHTGDGDDPQPDLTSKPSAEKQSVRIPPTSQFLLYGSALFALAVGFVCAAKGAKHPWAPPLTAVERFSYWLDPLLLQFASASVVFAMALRFYLPDASLSEMALRHIKAVVRIGIVIAVILVGAYLLTTFALKPAFKYNRPEAFGTDSFLVHWLGLTQRVEDAGCPSGFVLRETLLLMMGLVLARGIRAGSGGRIWEALVVALATLTALTAVVRVAMNAHTVFDVGMGFACGVYLFWLLYYTLVAVTVPADAKERQLYTDVSVLSYLFVPMFVLSSTWVALWFFLAIALLFFLGVLHLWATGHRARPAAGT